MEKYKYHGTGKKITKIRILEFCFSSFSFCHLKFNGKISGNVIVDNQISSQSENVLTNESGTIIIGVYFT